MALFILNGDKYKDFAISLPLPPYYKIPVAPRFNPHFIMTCTEAQSMETLPIEALEFKRVDDYFYGARYICNDARYRVFYIDDEPVILKVKQLTKAL